MNYGLEKNKMENPVNIQYNYAKMYKTENAFKPDMCDFAFALGYLFSRWVFLTWQGWGVAVFTTAYLISVTAYLIKKTPLRIAAPQDEGLKNEIVDYLKYQSYYVNNDNRLCLESYRAQQQRLSILKQLNDNGWVNR